MDCKVSWSYTSYFAFRALFRSVFIEFFIFLSWKKRTKNTCIDWILLEIVATSIG